MAEILPWPRSQFFDDDGNPLAGGKLHSYKAGSSIPLATYADKGATTPNTNPVVLDARGEALIFLSAQAYKLILKDANDVQIWSLDNFTVTQTDSESLSQAIADAQAAQTASETAQAAAEAAQAAAETAQAAAATSEANAASSASAAATSESNAATSETNAATSETNAAASATAAATSETNAATSASNAATSETNAAASAAAAATSETNAATSEANVASAVATHSADTTDVHGIPDTSELATKTGVETLTNKTLTAAKVASGLLLTEESSNPSTPSAGFKTLFAKNDGKVYTVASDGTTKEVGSGAGGSGGINYVEQDDSDFEAGVGNWTSDDGTGFASSVLTTGLETTAPLRGLQSLKISKSAASASGHYIRNDFLTTIDAADRGKVLWGSLEGDFSHANYASGDLTIAAYDITNGALIPAYVEGGTSGAFNSGKGKYIFRVATSATTAQVQLRIKGNSTSALAWDVIIDDVRLGPQEYVIGAASGRLPSYVPTLTSSGGGVAKGTTTRDVAYLYRDGSFLNVSYFYVQTAAGSAGTGYYEWTLPSGLTVDTNYQVVGSQGAREVPGSTVAVSIGTTYYTGYVLMTTSGKFSLMLTNETQALTISGATASGFVGDFATSQVNITVQFRIPIAQWTDDTVLSNSRKEYAYNTSTTTSDDTTSFGYGETGAAIQAFSVSGTSNIRKRVRFQSQISSTDSVQLQFSVNGINWFPAREIYFGFNYNDAGTTYYGAYADRVTGSTTDVDVNFFSAPYVGAAWSSFAGTWKWRVVKSANPLAVETAPREYKAATSSTKTPTATNTCLAMVGNSVTLPPGDWRISGSITFANNGGAGYTDAEGYWSTANGADTASVPTRLVCDAGSDALAAVLNSVNYYYAPMPTVRKRFTATTTIYLVPYILASTPANARVTTYIYAERIS